MATIDFQSAQDALADGLEDPAVLFEAARQGRVLVSHDVNTMIGHYRRFTSTAISPGLVLIPQDYPIGWAIENLVLLWKTVEASEFENRLCYLHSLFIGFP